MPYLKTLLAIKGSREAILCDTISHEGEFWIVPRWLIDPTKGVEYPERIIRLASIPHQKSDGKRYDFLLNDPMPKAVFDGQPNAQSGIEYDVRERPPLSFPVEIGGRN